MFNIGNAAGSIPAFLLASSEATDKVHSILFYPKSRKPLFGSLFFFTRGKTHNHLEKIYTSSFRQQPTGLSCGIFFTIFLTKKERVAYATLNQGALPQSPHIICIRKKVRKMLEIGTKVYIKPIPEGNRSNRPDGWYEETYIEREFGYVEECLPNHYYSVSGGWNVNGVFHENELIDMTTHTNTYKIGDEIVIHDVYDKELYPPIWVEDMAKHVGETATITTICENPDHYKLSGNSYVWHASNLKPRVEYEAF